MVYNEQLRKIKDTIWDYPASNHLFQDNTFPELCFKISCLAEQLFQAMLNPLTMIENGFNVGQKQDQIRFSYCALLKWAYRFSNMSDIFNIPQVPTTDGKALLELMNMAMNFNPIRKAFDDFDLSRYSVEVKSENEVVFSQNQTKRDMGASLYAHWVDSEKPEDQINEGKNNAMSETIKIMADPMLGETWKLYENKPISNVCFQKYYQICYNKVMADAEEKGDYHLDGYTLEQFKKVYSALMALGLMRFHEIFRNKLPLKKVERYDANRPIVYGTIKWLYSYLARTLKMGEDEVSRIIYDLTYDADFHKDRITIVQPLFVFDKYFFYSPTIVYLSMQQDKLLFIYKEKKKAVQLISKIAKDREAIMTADLVNAISSNSNLKCCTNYRVTELDVTKAEFDLILFDSQENKLLLAELKWFYKADGEYGHFLVDQKIQNSVQLRQQREKIAHNHLNEIMKVFIGNSDYVPEPEIMSCIVSKNYSGSAFLDDRLPVFDQFLFLQELEKCNYNLAMLFEDVKNKTYLPQMEDLNLKMGHYPIDYAGIKVWIPCYKSNMEESF